MKIFNFAKATVALFILANFATIALGDSATVPNNLSATATSCNSINLSWSAINDYTSLTMLIGFNGKDGAFSTEAYLSSTDISYNDSGLQSSRQYWYKIRGTKNLYDANGNFISTDTQDSNIAYATTPAPAPVTPGKPLLSINHGENNLTIYLTWIVNPNGNVPNACVQQSGFEVWRQSGSSPMALYQYYSTNSYLVTGIQNGVQYSYQVRAYLSTFPTAYSGFSPSTLVSVTGRY